MVRIYKSTSIFSNTSDRTCTGTGFAESTYLRYDFRELFRFLPCYSKGLQFLVRINKSTSIFSNTSDRTCTGTGFAESTYLQYDFHELFRFCLFTVKVLVFKLGRASGTSFVCLSCPYKIFWKKMSVANLKNKTAMHVI